MLQRLPSSGHFSIQRFGLVGASTETPQSLGGGVGNPSKSEAFKEDHPASELLSILGAQPSIGERLFQLRTQLFLPALRVPHKCSSLTELGPVQRTKKAVERKELLSFCCIPHTKQRKQRLTSPTAVLLQLSPRKQGEVIIKSAPKQAHTTKLGLPEGNQPPIPQLRMARS